MPTEIYLLKVGMTMTEGMVSEWYVADGGPVQVGEPLYALETEKVNMDVEAETAGTVRHRVETGVSMEPGEVIGFIFSGDEAIPDDLTKVPATPAAPESVAVAEPPVAAPPPQNVSASPAARRLARELGVDYSRLTGSGPGGRIVEADVRAASGERRPERPARVSPAARRRAREMDVDVSRVPGSGPGGRIVKEDIQKATQTGPGEAIPIGGMRRTIARRMHESLMASAQLTMDMEVVMDDAVRMREQLIEEWQADNIRPTYTDMVVRAVTKALGNHPIMNSELREAEILLLPDIHIGIAVSLEEGLVVPVVRNADRLSLKQVSVESARLAAAARGGSLGLDDYAGGTFTVTALGMYGVDSFTPIINSPQSGILGVNRIYDGIAFEDDKPVRSKRMKLSLTWDHRVLDGVPAAGFLGEVKRLLEAPYRLLV